MFTRALRALRTAGISALLVLLVGSLGLVFNRPWLYPSLGPTAYLLVHDAGQRNASFINTVGGHASGLLSGILASLLFGLANQPSVLRAEGHLSPEGVAAAVMALGLTVLLAASLRVRHPPAGSTALIVVLGGLSIDWYTVSAVLAGVFALASVGSLFRWLGLIGAETGPQKS